VEGEVGRGKGGGRRWKWKGGRGRGKGVLSLFILPTRVTVMSASLQITGASSTARTVTVVVRGSNKLVLEEADRSIHDALCVVRCLVKNRFVCVCV